MSAHREFRDWLSRQQLPRKTREAGLAVLAWLYMLENGCDTASVRERAAKAIAEFKGLLR